MLKIHSTPFYGMQTVLRLLQQNHRAEIKANQIPELHARVDALAKLKTRRDKLNRTFATQLKKASSI